MLPTIALVGRPNVGKSSIFNRLTRSNDAIVWDMPGVTRDRQYGTGSYEGNEFFVIDTGGIDYEKKVFQDAIDQQIELAIMEADILLFVVDSNDGITIEDRTIADNLRKTDKPVHILVNKAENLEDEEASAEFFELGFAKVIAVSALHKHGIDEIFQTCFEKIKLPLAPEKTSDDSIKIAFLGRPNVGKSTLTNTLLNEERVVVSPIAGTTRDCISIPLEYKKDKYLLIDTAGIRRRSKVNAALEKISVIKSMQAIKEADVIILLLDIIDGISEQDLRIVGLILNTGAGLLIVCNKCDAIDDKTLKTNLDYIRFRLSFLESFVPIKCISAKTGKNVKPIFSYIKDIHKSRTIDLSTSQLNTLIYGATDNNPPPLGKFNRRINIRYAHIGGNKPLRIILHGKNLEDLSETYKRYLANYLREKLKLTGVILHIVIKHSE
ncbi:MAG: ribosome biogenesis GTPase Der [Thiotrichales bacterium]|nr:MAG: ribosome biogenesis GTPase Der [Thiotrichales bacterium]